MFKSGLAAFALASVARPVLAGFNLASSNNVTVYWRQGFLVAIREHCTD
jgi:hypothetical protein